eukprot:4704939-Alexandrium_andersonii.AAC.1
MECLEAPENRSMPLGSPARDIAPPCKKEDVWSAATQGLEYRLDAVGQPCNRHCSTVQEQIRVVGCCASSA